MSFDLPRIGPALCALSAGILTLTDESSAQVMPQRNSRTLSAAMAEAGRSPFHPRDPVNRSMNARPAGGDPAKLFGEGTQTPGRFNETVEDPRGASDRAAGTASLVWSTALGTVAGDFLASRVFVDDDLIRFGTLSVSLAALAATGLGGGTSRVGAPRLIAGVPDRRWRGRSRCLRSGRCSRIRRAPARVRNLLRSARGRCRGNRQACREMSGADRTLTAWLVAKSPRRVHARDRDFALPSWL